MAQIKIVSVTKRQVKVDVTWESGLSKAGLLVDGVPVESFSAARQFLTDYISGIYEQVKKEKAATDYANPTPDPQVLAAVGHTFDDLGNLVS